MHDSLEPGTRILLRGDTTTNWVTDNPVLMERETGWDLDLRRVKIGDGVTAWNDLPWAIDTTTDVDAYFYPETYGAVGDGTTDDTDAFLACIEAAMEVNGTILLSAKTYGISDELQFVGVNRAVTLVGTGGDEGSVIKALAPDARLTWADFPTGPVITGCVLYGRPGMSHDFTFDGNQIATRGISVGVVLAYSTWKNVHVLDCDGDGWFVAPQNCSFEQCFTSGNSGNGWTVSYGCQLTQFIECHSQSNDGWNMEVRQDGGPGWGVIRQPASLHFQSCIVEVSGAPRFNDTGLGGFHVREGIQITFNNFDMTDQPYPGKSSLVLTPSTANGYVGQITVRDCRIEKIYLDANVGGVAQLMGGTEEPLFLDGWNYITEIVNGSQNYIYDDSQGPPVTYTAEGTGAAVGMRHSFRAKSANSELLRLINSAGTSKVTVNKDGTLTAHAGDAFQVTIGEVFSQCGIFFGTSFVPSITNPSFGVLYMLGQFIMQANGAGTVPVIAKGIASQTADLFQAQNSSGTALFTLDAGGVPRWNSATNQQTTVGAAGGASALPGNPAKYFKVKDSSGTVYVVPGWLAS